MRRTIALESISATPDTADPATSVRTLREIAANTPAERLLDNPLFRRELAELRMAEQHHRTRGIDVLDHGDLTITHPFLKDWIRRSNTLVIDKPGRSDLRRQRRTGILRFLDGENEGMPFDLPPVVSLPSSPWRNAEWRTFRLRDEMEYMELIYIPSHHPAVKMRPVLDVLSHRQARAILDWPASRLDYWLSAAPHLVGGLRQIEIAPDVREALERKSNAAGKTVSQPRRTLHRIAFATTDFMIWLAANQN